MRKVLYVLGQLSDEDVEWLIQAGVRRELANGHELIREGVQISELYILLAGTAGVQVGEREIARVGAGEILGEMSMIDERPPSATVRTVEPSIVLAISREMLERKLTSDMTFAAHFYRALAVFLSDRMRSTVAQLGYGKPKAKSLDDEDELDETVLGNVHMAGIRFEAIMKRLLRASQPR